MTVRLLHLVLAGLTLVSQVAVASHIPAFDDEPVSKCQDGSKHFCPEVAPEDSGPCILCQASVGGVAVTLESVSQAFVISGPVALAVEAGPRSSLKVLPDSPRAPPVG